MNGYKRIKAKFNSSCFKCGLEVFAGDDVDWLQGSGVKHPDCDTISTPKDDTNLLILEAEDQERLGLNNTFNLNKLEKRF